MVKVAKFLIKLNFTTRLLTHTPHSNRLRSRSRVYAVRNQVPFLWELRVAHPRNYASFAFGGFSVRTPNSRHVFASCKWALADPSYILEVWLYNSFLPMLNPYEKTNILTVVTTELCSPAHGLDSSFRLRSRSCGTHVQSDWKPKSRE